MTDTITATASPARLIAYSVTMPWNNNDSSEGDFATTVLAINESEAKAMCAQEMADSISIEDDEIEKWVKDQLSSCEGLVDVTRLDDQLAHDISFLFPDLAEAIAGGTGSRGSNLNIDVLRKLLLENVSSLYHRGPPVSKAELVANKAGFEIVIRADQPGTFFSLTKNGDFGAEMPSAEAAALDTINAMGPTISREAWIKAAQAGENMGYVDWAQTQVPKALQAQADEDVADETAADGEQETETNSGIRSLQADLRDLIRVHGSLMNDLDDQINTLRPAMDGALSEAFDDALDGLKGTYGADAANDSSDDDADQDSALDEVETWVADNITNEAEAILLNEGVEAGTTIIRAAIEKCQAQVLKSAARQRT